MGSDQSFITLPEGVGLSLLFKYFLGTLAVYYVWLVFFNLFFHPLRKFPGPKLAAATSFYYSSYVVTGHQTKLNEKLHAQYGEVVRITPNQLSFISAAAWRDIYGHRQGHKQLKKLQRSALRDGVHNIANAPDDVHARQRRLLSHAFSERALREQEPLVQSYVDLLIKNMRDDAKSGQEADMVKYYNYTTFDIIGDLAFAESFDALKSRKGHPWIESFFAFLKPGTRLNHLSTIPGLNLTIPLIVGPLLRRQVAMFRYTAQRIERRLLRGTERPDLMSWVMKNNEDMKVMSMAEVKSTFNLIMIAGSETTATMLSGCTYMLQKNPRVLQKLQEEIRGMFKSDKEITMLRVNKLPYLQAVIEEALRIYPPVPVALPRVTPAEGTTISGYHVPGNVVVGIAQAAAYHSPTNFTEPLSFIPERWIDKEHSRFKGDSKAVLQPFHVGPRNCLGRNLAYAEMKLILANVVFNFNLDLVDKKLKWEDQKTYNLYRKHPLMVRVKEVDVKTF